jgi:DNA (cytosine-5)-methyltransferase 3A
MAKKKITVLSLFDGISCGRVALDKVFSKDIYDINYYASEIDFNAISVSKKNYPDIIQLGDVKDIEFKNGILYSQNGIFNVGNIDLLLAGSPCQGFSKAGNLLGFDDPRSILYFEFERLLKETCPIYWFLENVCMKEEFKNIISDSLQIDCIKINSELVSAQNRNRLYWSNIQYPNIENKNITLKDIVGEYLGIFVLPRGTNKGGLKLYNGKSPCITTSAWQHNFFIVWKEWKYENYDTTRYMLKYDNNSNKNFLVSKFNITVAEMLQTLPVGYIKNKVSDNVGFKLIGNGWTVSVIVEFFKNMKKLF